MSKWLDACHVPVFWITDYKKDKNVLNYDYLAHQ